MIQSTREPAATYREVGFYSPLSVLSDNEVAHHMNALRRAERRLGNLHYRPKIHTVFSSPLELATRDVVLDFVEAVLGPDVLLYNATYIIKEAASGSFVSLHQDLTYWGFSGDQLTSMWLALSPATEASGCMNMVPKSHVDGPREHRSIQDPDNILFQNQTADGVAVTEAMSCPLRPGEASFHHGWTLHSSGPNKSDERRIGLNVQYIASSMSKQKGGRGSALLVRGQDDHRNFEPEHLASYDFESAAIDRHRELERLHLETAARPNS
jgi:ectoine hydroxylase-related dioxygenase (phytanoyl-CoA dioxygenase family)